MNAFSVMVAACPPLALLLAVELFNHALKRHRTATLPEDTETPENSENDLPTKQKAMRDYCEKQRAIGRVPTGAELDRAAGTNNYGRRLLRQWRQQEKTSARSDLS